MAQEPGEESETPKLLEKSLGATAPSIPRESRKSRGYGQIRFARDLSKAYVDVEIQGVNPADIIMFHIHGFLTQTKTLAGLEYLARKGVLYFNLHTKAHTYYGEMRGQIYAVKE